MNEQLDDKYHEALTYFTNKFRGTEEEEHFTNAMDYISKHGLELEVLTTVKRYCNEYSTVVDCCREIISAMSDWDI